MIQPVIDSVSGHTFCPNHLEQVLPSCLHLLGGASGHGVGTIKVGMKLIIKYLFVSISVVFARPRKILDHLSFGDSLANSWLIFSGGFLFVWNGDFPCPYLLSTILSTSHSARGSYLTLVSYNPYPRTHNAMETMESTHFQVPIY